MMEPPETRYVRCGEISIAYQEFGQGPHSLVAVPGMLAHLEALWSIPQFARMYGRLSRTLHVARFDRRGMGLSDRLAPGVVASLEERAEDVLAVMDAVGVGKTTLFASNDAAQVATFIAASFPERVGSLVLYAPFASMKRAPDFPLGLTEVQQNALLEEVREHWGSNAAPFGIERLAPNLSGDPHWRNTLARIQRLAAPPQVAVAAWRGILDIDLRHILPRVKVPTLVLHKTEDRTLSVAHGRYVASQIPDAQLRELPGRDHVFMVENADEVAQILEEWVTGRTAQLEPHRTVSSILFTDIVSSTRSALQMGDTRWTDLLEEHDNILQQAIAEHGGRVVDTTGDGVFAIFAAPGKAIQCALAIKELLHSLHLQFRAGVHTGEVECRGMRVSGIAVHIGARIVAVAQPGEILVSRTVRDLVVGSSIGFQPRGSYELKGLPEPWQLFAVVHRAT